MTQNETVGWPGHNDMRPINWRHVWRISIGALVALGLAGAVNAVRADEFKILYVVETLTSTQPIESAGRWSTFEQCEAARLEATQAQVKTIVAQSSSCVLASEIRGSFGGGGGGGGGGVPWYQHPSHSVSPH